MNSNGQIGIFLLSVDLAAFVGTIWYVIYCIWQNREKGRTR